MPGDVFEAHPVRLRKRAGRLRITSGHVEWQGQNAGDRVRIPAASIRPPPLVSKEGGKSAMIKLKTADDPDGIVLDFPGATGSAPPNFPLRNRTKDAILAAMKGGAVAPPVKPPAPAKPQNTKEQDKQASTASSPEPQQKEGRTQAAPARPRTSSSPPAGAKRKPSREEIVKRMQILYDHQDIRKLHQRLVAAGHISDDAFFEAISFRLKKSATSAANDSEGEDPETAAPLKRGVPSSFDDQLSEMLKATDEVGNKRRFELSQSVINEIFVRFPEVHRAYKAVVPGQMNDETFFRKFLESPLFNRDRRSMGMDQDADDLFSKYRVEAREESERELRERVATVLPDINLDRSDPHTAAHVTEGHSEVSTVAIAARRSTPFNDIAQRVNRHGTLVVDSNEAQGGNGSRVRAWREIDEHQMPDLEPERHGTFTKLTIKDGRGFFGQEHSEKDGHGARTKRAREEDAQAVVNGLRDWSPDLRRAVRPSASAAKVLDELAFGESGQAGH